jgi:hypothetical protein
MDVFSAASTNYFVDTILNNTKLSSIENHTYVWVAEIKFFITRAAPRELGHFAAVHVTEQ